jgi:hypothetical protein
MENFSQLLIEEYGKENKFPLSHYRPHSNEKVWWTCYKCNYKWKTKITHRSNGSKCAKCAAKQNAENRNKKKKTIQETHPKIAKELVNNVAISFGSNKICDWMCGKCSQIFRTSPNARCISNRGCPYCSGRLPTSEKNLLVLRPDLAEELLDFSLADKLLCYSNKIIQWKCKKCKNIWKSTINNRSRGNGCPSCAKKNSKPQQEIEKILKQMKISFKKEHRFVDCKNKRTLPFDFFLNSLNAMIEYQGEQHYLPIWGKNNFLRLEKNDKIKKIYCQKNSIPLLIIPYYNKNILFNIIRDFIIYLTGGNHGYRTHFSFEEADF